MLPRGRPAETPKPSLLCGQVCIASLASHLRWCARFNALQEGMAAHHHILKQDLHRNPFLRNLLLLFYGECGELDAAHALFALCPHDVFSYNFMIAAFMRANLQSQALHLFHQMHLEAILPDRVTYAAVFATLASLSLIEAGRFVHACIFHCLHVSVATAIMHMYGKLSSLHDAQLTFHHMHAPDVVAWNCILAVHVDHQHAQESLVLYERMKLEGIAPDQVTYISLLSACRLLSDVQVGEQIHHDLTCRGFDAETVVGNALVSMYADFYLVDSALIVFEKMPKHSVASWNTIIGAYSQRNERAKALNLFNRMQEEGVEPDKITFLNVIPVYPPWDALRLFDTITDGDVLLWNALLSSFLAHRRHGEVVQLFCQMQAQGVMPNERTFMILMSVCSSERSLPLGMRIHVLATSRLEHDTGIGNALLTMCGKTFSLEHAKITFNSMSDRAVVSWTIMLTLLTHYDECAEAVQSFDRMLLEGVLPDRFVFASILEACVGLTSLTMGKCIHGQILQAKSAVDAVTGTALLNMYADCGCLRAAKSIFSQMCKQNTSSYNAIISALARHGQVQPALRLFECMCIKSIAADSTTYLGLMTACSHCGLIEEGIYHFCSMQSTYSVQWTGEHFDCIVDLLGRAGQVKGSVLIIDNLHLNPTTLTYRTLLSACCRSGDVMHGWQAANRALSLEPDDEGCCFLLRNFLDLDSVGG